MTTPLNPAPTPPSQNPMECQYQDAIALFSRAMLNKLEANSFKGGRLEWQNWSPLAASDYLRDELKELDDAIKVGDALAAMRACADVANFALMIFDWYACRHAASVAPAAPQGETPETDANQYVFSLSNSPDYDGPFHHVPAHFARTLERQRDQARRELAEVKAEYEKAFARGADLMRMKKEDEYLPQIEHARKEVQDAIKTFTALSDKQQADLLALRTRAERAEGALRAAGAIVSEYATEQRGFANQIISPRHAKQARLDEAERAERVLVQMNAALTPQPTESKGEKEV